MNYNPCHNFNFNFLIVVLFLSSACSGQPDKFTLLSPSQTGIHFVNELNETPEFNIINYLYYYDGAGVAIGDLNNNGFPDLFVTGNEVHNKLYLNNGDFSFEDITDQAGITDVENAWSTGVTMADVNGNGYLDIYVSRVNYLTKEGPNQLFINNGDLTFTEKAADYGLDFTGYSTQAAFFDYNRNGRLDLFLLNHSFHGENTYGMAETLRNIPDPKAGDRLFRNDGDTFTDVTEEAGIISSALGYGLGVAIADINKNGWPDIYVGNDFHEDDYFYLNNGDGTFTESLYEMISHTSGSSMGNDIADLSNDGYLDIVSLDMMPEDHEIYMRSGGPDIELIYRTKKDFGFGEKNARNTLQIHRGLSPDGTPVYSETAFSSGIAKTDWSWASLFMDINNNGYKDLFVTNGMIGRPNDLDYIRGVRQVRDQQEEGPISQELFDQIQLMPELKIPNYMFKNNGDLRFSDVTIEYGFAQPSFSSGAAYADLNNNGRLDLVISNNNEPLSIYKNNLPDEDLNNYLQIKLNGNTPNTTGVGTKVKLFEEDQIYYQENFPTRGFQSAVDHRLHFGVGTAGQIDSLVVIWPNQAFQIVYDIDVNQLIELNQDDAEGEIDYSIFQRTYENAILRDRSDKIEIPFIHQENEFNDFNREPLIPYKLSTLGPALAVGDINGSGMDDLYLGGAHGQSGSLLIQQENGNFEFVSNSVFDQDAEKEDVDALFFDATGNGLPDLYVVSGGSEETGQAELFRDRLYLNIGDGEFEKAEQSMPEIHQNGAVVRAADFNNNGHLDLFVGGRSVPWAYGAAASSYLLENDGNGNFRDVTDTMAPQLSDVGMVTDALWANITNDDVPYLVIVGEWMPITVFEFSEGTSRDVTERFGFEDTNGLWQSVYSADLNGNGFEDLIAGNFGTNSRINATKDSPFRIYVNDFDGDGLTTGIIARYIDGDYYPFEQLDELLLEFPDLGQQVGSYYNYANSTITDLFGNERTEQSEIREIYELRSMIYENDRGKRMNPKPLPFDVHTFPVMAIEKIQSSGNPDILLGGNLYDVKPSTGGKLGSGYGLYLQNQGESSFKSLSMQESGFYTPGEIREIRQIKTMEGVGYVVARNNDSVLIFRDQE